jgi:hypothetical protein
MWIQMVRHEIPVADLVKLGSGKEYTGIGVSRKRMRVEESLDLIYDTNHKSRRELRC